MDEEYLGDGLYASFDGYQIWLRAPGLMSEQKVALEPPVYKKLIDFAHLINREKGTNF